MKIKPINEFVKALFVVDFHWLRIKTEKANVIDIDSKTGKMTTVLKFFMILFFSSYLICHTFKRAVSPKFRVCLFGKIIGPLLFVWFFFSFFFKFQQEISNLKQEIFITSTLSKNKISKYHDLCIFWVCI